MTESLNLREKIREEISYKKRDFIANLIFVFLIWLLYFGVILGILISILFKSVTFFFILYALFFIFFILYKLFIPSKFEKVTYDIGELANNLDVNSTKKQILFRMVMRDLDKLSKRKKGFNSIIFNTLRDYFDNVLVYLIFSKRKEALRVIKEGLLEISNCEDTHSLYDAFIKLNKKVINLNEFLNLLDVSLSFSSEFDAKDLHNPFKWIKKINKDSKGSYLDKIKYILNFLDERGVIKVILILIITTLFGWILDKMGLLDWAIKVIPNIIK